MLWPARLRLWVGAPPPRTLPALLSIALAPVNELRWRNPQPAPRRGELFRATEVGPVRGYYFTEVSNFTYTALQWCSPEIRRVCHTTELPYVLHNLLSKEEIGDFAPAETRLAKEMRLAWTSFAKNPFATDPHLGWVALEGVSDGPYIQWETPVSRVGDLDAIVHYDLWSTIEPTDRPNEAACHAATSANDGP